MATIAEQITKLKDRIQADTAKLEKLEADQAAAAALANVAKGDTIRYVFGRKDSRGTFSGEVRSIIDTDKGRIIRVTKGTDAEEEIVSIRPSDIVIDKKEAAEAGVNDALDAVAAAEGNAKPQAASDDPLANLS